MSEDTRGTSHVVIVGAGAVGLTLATFLEGGGHRVILGVRDPSTVILPIRLDDEIGGQERTLESVATSTLLELPREPDHVVVCTRGEQLPTVLKQLAERLEPNVPVTIAAATLDDLHKLAQDAGLSNPLQRMGIGFAAWPVAERRYRLFSLTPAGSGIGVEPPLGDPGARDDLAWMLDAAGLPTRAAPTFLFRPLFRAVLATEVAWLLAYERAGWELETLARNAELLGLCGRATREALQVLGPELGLIGRLARAVPVPVHERRVRRRARHATDGYRDVWRHHGPKTTAQLKELTRQLAVRAGGVLPPALGALAAARA